MALVARSTKADIDTISAQRVAPLPQLAAGKEWIAGEDLDVAAPCYIKSSDGKLYMSNGTAANEAAEVIGFTPKAYKSGDVVTLYPARTVFYYSDDFSADSVNPGDKLYIGATKGRLDAAVTTGDARGVAIAGDNNHIIITRDHYCF